MENKDNNKYATFMRVSWCIIILGLVFILGVGIKGICTDYSDLKEKVSSQEKTIENKNETISKYKKNEKELKDTIAEYEEQINFMNKYIAICPSDGKSTFHQYTCEHYDSSVSFSAFVIPEAKRQGFKPCKYCEKDNKTKASKNNSVYITDSGSKYHREWCSYLKSKNIIDKDEAIEQGYEPCSRCNP